MTANESAAQKGELTLHRVLDAPRKLVWRAWTQREQMMRWCAPHGFAITHCENDLRVGGAWRSCMCSPQGENLWVGGEYRSIVEPETLVFTHVWDEADRPRHETLVTLNFADENGKTRMTFRQQNFRSDESRDGHEGGWTQSFARLNDFLGEMKKENA